MSKNKFLKIGKIINTHGIKGEVKIESYCDTPEDFCNIGEAFLDVNDVPVEIVYSKVHKNHILAKISGIDTCEQAEVLKGRYLYADRDDIPLEEDYYFIEDLKGCKVFDAGTGREYGDLKDVWNAGASDIYTVEDSEGNEYYVPIIGGTVEKIDLDRDEIFINPLKGIFEDEN